MVCMRHLVDIFEIFKLHCYATTTDGAIIHTQRHFHKLNTVDLNIEISVAICLLVGYLTTEH